MLNLKDTCVWIRLLCELRLKYPGRLFPNNVLNAFSQTGELKLDLKIYLNNARISRLVGVPSMHCIRL